MNMKEIIINGTKVKVWAKSLDVLGWNEVMNMTRLPFLPEQGISLMPDAHAGYGVPIGTVLPCINAVIPTAVGNDAGCGMRAIKTNIRVEDIPQDTLKKVIMRGIRKQIMIGDKLWKEPQSEDLLPSGWDFGTLPAISANNGWKLATRSIATQGGGNHFEELQKDEEGRLWIMIHSGSRGLGGRVFMYYNQLAKNYCLEWAKCNRQEMMKRTIDVLGNEFPYFKVYEEIDIHHNYVDREHHFGQELYVHRKGAVCTGHSGIFCNEFPTQVIIPGSMGTASYICEGIWNHDAYNSCSHGAGRALSRTEARQLDMAKEVQRLDELGVVHGIRGKADLEECTSAYKNIDEVLELESNLVRPIVKLKPIAVLKG